MANLSLRKVKKSYGDTPVIKGVDIEINDGEFVVFVGPSGCGKSTLLRMIAGLEDITDGELEIGGHVVNELEPKDRKIAMVFQSYAIFPHMTVRENMAFGLTIAKASQEEKDSKVNEAARILKMEHLLDRRPSQLSGGQRQRVAIGRAIVRQPSVFLFDEPLSNLDAALRMDMRMEISKLHKQLDATMIYVTHDQVEAMTLADKIVVLKDGEVQQIGAPMDLYHNPVNKFVAGFLGSPSMNFIEVRVNAVREGEVEVQSNSLDPIWIPSTIDAPTIGEQLSLGLRPQYLTLCTDTHEGKLHGKVVITERLGTETVVDLSLKDESRIIASVAEDAIFAEDQEVSLTFDPTQAHLFRDVRKSNS
jgi:multiple sugar transport system ATP-binding protein